MITREEAAALLADMDDRDRLATVELARVVLRTVVALYDERAKVVDERAAARIVLQQLAPQDHVEWVWPDDFPDGEKPDCLCAACGDAVLVETGYEWAQGRDVCHDCAAMRSEALSAVTRERDALRAELDTFAAFHRAKTDAVALEIRRLRAAEAPGTDDEAVAPWEDAGSDDRVVWRYWLAPGRAVIVSPHAGGWRWFGKDTGWSDPPLPVALDAMRAAVPGSV